LPTKKTGFELFYARKSAVTALLREKLGRKDPNII